MATRSTPQFASGGDHPMPTSNAVGQHLIPTPQCASGGDHPTRTSEAVGQHPHVGAYRGCGLLFTCRNRVEPRRRLGRRRSGTLLRRARHQHTLGEQTPTTRTRGRGRHIADTRSLTRLLRPGALCLRKWGSLPCTYLWRSGDGRHHRLRTRRRGARTASGSKLVGGTYPRPHPHIHKVCYRCRPATTEGERPPATVSTTHTHNTAHSDSACSKHPHPGKACAVQQRRQQRASSSRSVPVVQLSTRYSQPETTAPGGHWASVPRHQASIQQWTPCQ